MPGPFSFNSHNGKRWLLCFLLPALIFAQWMGLAHRLSHGGWTGVTAPASLIQHGSPVSSFLFGSQDDSSLHSCALYDAATGSEYLHHIPDIIHLIDGKAIIADSQIILSWLALLRLPFSSRAPPSLFA
ncbi:hypothetical protein [Undibacterium sp. TS12]|uniref:hypothetical protein n=1 Tax=Undibacterium sp. TS12 TaxID=2908202 RepID=UPI001F4CE97A|nr:hypothetical protein [Undibacterium sp. TS12]MCH8621164.1 hypothetical protein [Undibacterium sp. TS12]